MMIDALADPTRIVVAILVAAALLAMTPVLLRRLRPSMRLKAGDDEELAIMAQRTLDMRHRIVVVRHRGTEHLLILGGSLPVVVGKCAGPTGPTAAEADWS